MIKYIYHKENTDIVSFTCYTTLNILTFCFLLFSYFTTNLDIIEACFTFLFVFTIIKIIVNIFSIYLNKRIIENIKLFIFVKISEIVLLICSILISGIFGKEISLIAYKQVISIEIIIFSLIALTILATFIIMNINEIKDMFYLTRYLKKYKLYDLLRKDLNDLYDLTENVHINRLNENIEITKLSVIYNKRVKELENLDCLEEHKEYLIKKFKQKQINLFYRLLEKEFNSYREKTHNEYKRLEEQHNRRYKEMESLLNGKSV